MSKRGPGEASADGEGDWFSVAAESCIESPARFKWASWVTWVSWESWVSSVSGHVEKVYGDWGPGADGVGMVGESG